MDRPNVSVVIVSYNTRDMTLSCLEKLYASLEGISSEVWLVDNASSDGSVDAIRSRFPDVKIIANTENAGFGAANNQAMRLAAGRYILLLNSDAFVEPGTVRTMIEYLDTHPDVGLVGPRLLNKDGSLQPSCYRFPSPGRAWVENLWISALLPSHPVIGDYRKWAHDEPRMVDWVIGACFALRREIFESVGGFDEGFFMYAEEADWQRRIRDAGWKIAFTPATRVVHLGGASGAREKARINRHFFDSLDYYQLKHHGKSGLISLRTAMVIGCTLRAALWAGVAPISSRRRELAVSKVKMHGWLVRRQATHWRPLGRTVQSDTKGPEITGHPTPATGDPAVTAKA